MDETLNTIGSQSIDQEGNVIDYGESSANGVVEVPRDNDGKMIMTARIEPRQPRSYSLEVNMPSEEELESQRIEKILHEGLLASQKENSVTTEDLVNGHLPEGTIKARTRFAEAIPLSRAGLDDLVTLPNGLETDACIAETMGYIRRNPNGIGYQEVEDKE